MNNRLIGVTYPNGIVEDFAGGKPLAVLSGPALDWVKDANLVFMQALTATSLVGTVPNANTIYTVDLNNGNIHTTKLETPEIAHAWTVDAYKKHPKGANIIGAFAVDERGKIDLLITGQPPGTAVLLQVDGTGSIERGLRCPVAAVDVLRSSGTPDGFMISGLIGGAGQSIFVVDPRGHVVSCPIVP